MALSMGENHRLGQTLTRIRRIVEDFGTVEDVQDLKEAFQFIARLVVVRNPPRVAAELRLLVSRVVEEAREQAARGEHAARAWLEARQVHFHRRRGT